MLSVATDEFDLVVEGEAGQVTDPPTVAAMAARWAAEGWPAWVDESGRAITADYSSQQRRHEQIVVNEFMSLDGVVQAPGGPEEDTEGGFAHGGWSNRPSMIWLRGGHASSTGAESGLRAAAGARGRTQAPPAPTSRP